MRLFRSRAGAIIVAFTLGLAACSSSGTAPANSQFAIAAKQVVDDVAAGNFANVTQHFDPDVKAHYSGAQLASDWQQFQDQAGNYISRGEPKEVKQAQITTELVPVKLSKKKGQVQVSYHPDGTIAGIHFQPK